MFSAFFIRRPKFAMVISLFIMLAGLVSVWSLPIAEYPEVAPPTIMVMASYTGASAKVIAETVAAPIEAEVNGVEGLIYYSSNSNNSGGYQLTLTFSPETDPDIALVNVNNAVKRAEPMLPNEVVMTGIRSYKRTSDFLGIVAFSSDNPDHTQLFMSNYVSINVKDAVYRIDGVGQAIILGEMAYSMRVWLDPIRMRYFEIGHEEVLAALRGQNIQAATGSVGTEGSSDYMQFKVETKGRLRDPAEFQNIIVRSADQGRLVRISDIAEVELGAETYSGRPSVNGSPAVMLAIFKLSDGNALDIMNKSKGLISELAEHFPEGMTWSMPYDSTTFVKATMQEIVTTLVLTFVLVVLITYVFLQDWRATLIPTVAIPVSLIGTFMFMNMAGMSINTLTMFALILVIGSVVDDAICVVECCIRLIHEEHLSPMEAALQTMRELTGALLATTLVVVAIYTPLGFFGGMVGIIYRQFAITMCIALCLSTVVALTLSPAMCALVLHDPKPPRGFFKMFNAGLDFTRNRYLNVAGLLARRIVLTIIVMAGLLAGNYFLYNDLPSAFLPEEDKGAILGEAVLPAGASLPRTQEVLDEMVGIAKVTPGVSQVISAPGFSITSGDGENLGIVIIDLEDWGKRTTKDTQINAIMGKIVQEGGNLSEATINAFVPPPIMGLGATGGVSFALQATGDQSLLELYQATNLLIGKIMESGQAMYAMTSFDMTTPMLDLELDRDKAEAMNVSVASVFSSLQAQLGSIYVNDFNLYGKTYKVKIQAEGIYRENPNALGQITVTANDGTLVPLEALATIKWTLGAKQVERFNMFYAANVRAQGLPNVSSGTLMELCEKLVSEELSGDYKIAWTDMSYQESQNEGQILVILALAITFAYLFLVAQYESWTTPVSVMLSVVTATLGGMVALKLYNHAMDIYCQLGLLMLVGLTAKTAILMVEYSKQLRDEGQTLIEASLNGMRVRFRAVMMTALSFVIGVSPMVIATGAGAGSRQSIGITTFFGMLVATVIGMMLIPGLYVITRSMSETTKRLCGISVPDDGVPRNEYDVPKNPS